MGFWAVRGCLGGVCFGEVGGWGSRRGRLGICRVFLSNPCCSSGGKGRDEDS
jgi:hypothetical protein